MPALFVFLIKVNVALIIFCLGYYLVLRRLTFYTLNRVYLFIAIIFSSVYPLINVNSLFRRAIPVQTVIINWKAPAEKFIQQPGYWHWATMLFWAGAALLAIRLLIQLASLYKLYKSSKPGKIQEQEVRIINADMSPFSFWQSIYINPTNLNPGDLQSILQHEQIHVKEWHTLDILLAEISVIFYWFNPGVWLMKKAVRENIEFITDRKILQEGIDGKAYQYSLLNVSFNATTSAGITNHFNFSTLKKRIVMMNAKRSSNVNLTRYALLVPAVLVLLLIFSFSKAELVKKSKIAYKTIAASVISLNPINAITHNAVAHKKNAQWAKTLDTGKKSLTFKQGTDIDTKSFTINYKLFPKKDTIIVDTTKKLSYGIVITKSIRNKALDSVTFIIDGKIAKNSDFNHVDPKEIESFSVVHSANGVILVQTKRLGVRLPIEDLISANNNLSHTFSNPWFGGKRPIYFTVISANAQLGSTGANNNLSHTFISRSNDSAKVDLKVAELLSKMQGMKVTSDGNLTHNAVTVSKINVNGQPVMVEEFLPDNKTFFLAEKSKADNPTLFTGKLILVDDKESADSDKIPADKVKNIKMRTATADDITKYGDKAKNGIIIITTKK